MSDPGEAKEQLMNELSEFHKLISDSGTGEIDRTREKTEWKRAFQLLQTIMDAVNDPIVLIGVDYEVKLMNLTARKSCKVGTGAEPLYCYQVFHDGDTSCSGAAHPCPLEQVRTSLRPVTVVHDHVRKDGKMFIVEINASPLFGKDGSLLGIVESGRDITERVRTEEVLQRHKDELEILVEKRTADLHASNIKLRQEIDERKRAEGLLQKNERKLSEQNILLQEKNMALKEMTEQLRAEKERIEAQVVSNVDSLLLPLLTKLRNEASKLDRKYIILLEENVKEMISSFGNEISKRMYRLTPKELEICNMIRNGMTSKEIASLTHSSSLTVERHRNNIRKKLGLRNRKINLTAYLNSI